MGSKIATMGYTPLKFHKLAHTAPPPPPQNLNKWSIPPYNFRNLFVLYLDLLKIVCTP